MIQLLILSTFISNTPKTSRLSFLTRFLTHLFLFLPPKPHAFQIIIRPIERIKNHTLKEPREVSHRFFLLIHYSISFSINPCSVYVISWVPSWICKIAFPISQQVIASSMGSVCNGSHAWSSILGKNLMCELLASSSLASSFLDRIITFLFIITLSETKLSITPISACLEP